MSGTTQIKPKTSFLRWVVRIIMSFLVILLAGSLILTAILLSISPGKPAPFLEANGSVLKDSISEKIHVDINGARQGMFIRGRNIHNPVLLFVHGGPGMPEYFLSEKYGTALENDFTVCYWEQRGGGLSYTKGMSGDGISAEQLVSDTIAVTLYLRERFGQEKVYLLAHSWGTFIGIQAAEKAPELYHAYIGMAQVVNMVESEKQAYRYMLEQYASTGNTKMIDKLKAYPILDSNEKMIPYFKSILRDQTMHQLGIGTMHNMNSIITGVFIPIFQARAYTLEEKITIWRAKAFLRSDTDLLDELFSTDISAVIPKLEIPVYFLSGAFDYTVSQTLSKQYFDMLQAPVKGFYTFEQSAHTPLFEEPEKVIQIMREDVLNAATGLADSDE